MGVRRALTAATVAGMLMAASVAAAQIPDPIVEPTDADFAVARDAFVEGIALAERDAHRQALEAFERSYRLSGSPAALYNLASTLRHLGRFVDADEAVTRLLSLPEIDAETRERARGVQSTARAQLAHLVLYDVPSGGADVLVDGRVRTRDTGRPLRLSLDPGLRVVRVELEGHPSFTWTDTVDAGQQEEVRYAVQPDRGSRAGTAPPLVGAVGTPLAEPSPDESVNWAAILGVGFGALALVVGGVVLGLVLASPSIQPRTDLVIRLP